MNTRDSAPEIALRKALWAAGLRRWRLQLALPGKPDRGVDQAARRSVCRRAFWHGNPDFYWGQSGPFWDKKIAANRARDQRVNAELVELGFEVVRVWDFEVAADPDGCASRVSAALAAAPPCPTTQIALYRG